MRFINREEWLGAFRQIGFQMVKETGVMFIGHHIFSLLAKLRLTNKCERPANLITKLLRQLMLLVDLGLSRIPFLIRYSDLHLFLLQKTDHQQ